MRAASLNVPSPEAGKMPAKPAFGEVLGHYRLLERVGQGGMGVVYRARDEHLQREVALKLLPDNVTHDESARRRFRQEALTLARLNHPNIETLYSFESDGDKDFLVMEYIRGVTLASRLAAGPLGEPELIEYATQLASALEEAHKEGVIHRDLQAFQYPDNSRRTIEDAGFRPGALAHRRRAEHDCHRPARDMRHPPVCCSRTFVGIARGRCAF